jgi:short-subunit dehydrogenase
MSSEQNNNGTGLLGATFSLIMGMRKLAQKKKNELVGQVVLITGGSRGLGLALAEAFAREGSKIVICARNIEELERARHELAERGAEVIAIPCDVTDHEQVLNLVKTTTEKFGRIDILVNNAGIITVGPMMMQTYKDFEDSMNIMFWGTFHPTMAVLPHMQERKSGHIVNITSIGGKISVPHLLSYSSAKFAAVGFSQGLHAELAKEGIKVLTVMPGLMRTGSYVNITTKGKHQAEYSWFSVLANLPVTSTSAKKAAQQIVKATQSGKAELVISIQAKLAILFQNLFPGLMASLLVLTDRLLPKAGGLEDLDPKAGKETPTRISESVLTTLGQKAAKTYNEEVTP